MRCVHCGKEVRNNVIFCIHCDRPIKREYSKYSCEFYNSLSIWDTIANTFSCFSSKKKNYRHDVGSKKIAINCANLKDTIKQKGSSIKELYNNYTMENQQQTVAERQQAEITKDALPILNIDESDTYSDNSNQNTHNSNQTTQTTYNDQEPEYFGLDDLKNIKESAKNAFRNFSNSSEEEQKNILKVIGIVISVIVFFISICISSTSSNEYYESYTTDYEESESYSFPENPIITSDLVESIDCCPLGSEELITNYLEMLYYDTYELRWYDESLYSLEDFQPYISEIEQITSEYDNDPNYMVYDELIYINDLWKELVQPLYENNDNFEQWQIDDNLEEFSFELENVCSYYIQEQFK